MPEARAGNDGQRECINSRWIDRCAAGRRALLRRSARETLVEVERDGPVAGCGHDRVDRAC